MKPFVRLCLVFGMIGMAGSAQGAPRKIRVTQVKATKCDTDGGPMTCSRGVKRLAAAYYRFAQKDLRKNPIPCGPGRAQRVAVSFLYEYNEGSIEISRKGSKLPCVTKVFLPRLQRHFKALWVQAHKRDRTVDVRCYFQAKLVIR